MSDAFAFDFSDVNLPQLHNIRAMSQVQKPQENSFFLACSFFEGARFVRRCMKSKACYPRLFVLLAGAIMPV